MTTPPSPKTIRILLADDHLIVRAGIRQILEHADDIQVVAEAGDGEAAKTMIQEHQPDVAVLDIQMPKASGIEVTRWLRSQEHNLGAQRQSVGAPQKTVGAPQKTVGVLILTAYDDDPYVMAVLQAGANGYVLKTTSPEHLIQAVRDVYAGKSALDAAITQKLMAQISSHSDTPPVEPVTDRELEVLALTARGFTNKAIALQLGISDRTVQGHLAHIFDKLHASSRTEAVMRAISLGWISQKVGEITDE